MISFMLQIPFASLMVRPNFIDAASNSSSLLHVNQYYGRILLIQFLGLIDSSEIEENINHQITGLFYLFFAKVSVLGTWSSLGLTDLAHCTPLLY